MGTFDMGPGDASMWVQGSLCRVHGCSRVAQVQDRHAIMGYDHLSLFFHLFSLCPCETLVGVLCPNLEFAAQEKDGPVQTRSEEPLGYSTSPGKTDWESWVVQPGEEKTLGTPHWGIPVLKETYKKNGE
ncbi:hypothetical protein BTVI_06144 [Pitangus sulphuratus]|nr:hypothetical protein BTVI_06144 [Pitangus sulphuratus]